MNTYNSLMSNPTTTLNDIAEQLHFIVDKIGTMDEKITTMDEKIDTNHLELTNKLAGIDRRLDSEAMQRTDQKLPSRVADLETKVFGKSRESQIA